jgi:hypothetical protein
MRYSQHLSLVVFTQCGVSKASELPPTPGHGPASFVFASVTKRNHTGTIGSESLTTEDLTSINASFAIDHRDAAEVASE